MLNYLKKRFGEHSTTFGLTLVATSALNYSQGMDWKTSIVQAFIGLVMSAVPTRK